MLWATADIGSLQSEYINLWAEIVWALPCVDCFIHCVFERRLISCNICLIACSAHHPACKNKHCSPLIIFFKLPKYFVSQLLFRLLPACRKVI